MLNIIILIALAWTGMFLLPSPGWGNSTKGGIICRDEIKRIVVHEAVRMQLLISLAIAVAQQVDSNFDLG
jgi:hypothetical protein